MMAKRIRPFGNVTGLIKTGTYKGYRYSIWNDAEDTDCTYMDACIQFKDDSIDEYDLDDGYGGTFNNLECWAAWGDSDPWIIYEEEWYKEHENFRTKSVEELKRNANLDPSLRYIWYRTPMTRGYDCLRRDGTHGYWRVKELMGNLRFTVGVMEEHRKKMRGQ